MRRQEQSRNNSAGRRKVSRPDHRRQISSAERRRLVRLREGLLGWFAGNRRDFPWRKTKNWFHLIVAEMMLRRTRAEQALSAYKKFTGRFLTVSEALAEPDEVRRIIATLGLNWRNEALFSTLHHLRDHLDVRRLPPGVNLRAIPGVGEYSEGMLRSMLFHERTPAVDVNVVRILQRYSGIKPVSERELRRDPIIIERARILADCDRPSEVNLALIDFGALVCRSPRPLCEKCPLSRSCMHLRSLKAERISH